MNAIQSSCCVVGAGPGGAILALLLARQGISVTLLEAQEDFDRDFRGDTIHPNVLHLMDQLGL
ncbi:MAG TPA: FAD-dependent monooxygenase, partial [Pyrinomonadaceae bacterium]|nr:FAD-dependent monooxygenase [Pyrinomonadaceae bacterium]